MVVLAAGFYFAIRGGSAQRFMDAGRSLSAWVVGFSLLGTWMSSITFLAYPAKTFGGNWSPFLFELVPPLMAVIAVMYIIPFYRKSGHISAYTHLGERFGPWACIYAVVCFFLTKMGRIGVMMYLVAVALTPLTGWSNTWVIIVVGVVVTAYTYFGGIEGVIWTDVLQSIVLMTGAVVCVYFIFAKMPGGATQVFEIAKAGNKFSFGEWDLSLIKPTGLVVILYSISINFRWLCIDQSFVQRYMVAKSDKAATRSVWIGLLMTVPVAGLFCLIGTGLYAFYTAQPGLVTAAGDVFNNNDAVLPYFIMNELPSGAVGFLIAAILAAAMSSIDSDLNAAATLFLCNIYKPYVCLNMEVSDRESKNVLHAVSLILGGLAIGMAFWLTHMEGAILDLWWKLSGVFGGGILGLFLLGLISRKATRPVAIWAVVLGVATIIWMTVSPGWTGDWAAYKSPFHSFMISVMGTAVILVGGLFLTIFVQNKRKTGQTPGFKA